MTAPAAISAVLSVTDAAPGRDHAVHLAIHGPGIPGLEDQTATAILDVGLAQALAAEAGAFAACLNRSTPLRQRITAGERLSAAVLGGDVAELWTRAVNLAADGHRLRVRVDVRPPRLRVLPWELLRCGGTWLSLRQNLSAWRGAQPVPPAPEDTGPLRVLVVVCNPLDHRVLADDELAVISGELGSRLGRTFVEILDGPSRSRLSGEIDRLQPHILHFIGHGMPRTGQSDPELSFNWIPDQSAAQEPGQPWSLFSYDVDQLAEWQPRLVVINACRTATDPLDPVGGFAEAFLAAGTRAVVSMQADIESPAAVSFSSALYKGLGDFAPLDEIVAAARRRVRMDSGDNGEWALPVLAASTDPADALRVCFARAVPIAHINARREYDDLRAFLDRSAERWDAWWALDPQSEQVPSRPVLVVRGRPVGESKAGKTWFTHWCLLTCYLRGHRVTYLDLRKPLSRPGRDGGWPSSGPTKEWLDVIRAIREACISDRQLQPLPAAAFGRFNACLNAMAAGRSWKADQDDAHPEEDEWQSFDYDRRHAQERTSQLWSAFLALLRETSAACPHIIALDNADSILPSGFDSSVYPGLIRPVAEDVQSTVRLMLVASDEWLGSRLPEADSGLWTSVHLGGFDPAQFMRLARDYCHRLGLNTDRALMFYKIREQMYKEDRSLGAVPLNAFCDAIKGVSRAWLAGRP